MSDEDPFADVRGDLGGVLGIMEGMGVSDQYSARDRVVDEGVAFQMRCDNCGQPNVVTVNWSEFIYGANRLIPPGWVHDPRHGALHPNKGCASCRALLLILFKPDECARHLKGGIMANKITPDQVQQANNNLRQQALTHRR